MNGEGEGTGDLLRRPRDEARAVFRKAILDAAETVFAERGFHGARIQDIAARARIAVGTVYNHFGQKDDVLLALLEERTEELLNELTPRRGDPAGFVERLKECVGRMLEYVHRHRAFFVIASEHGLFAGPVAAGARSAGRPLAHVEKFRAIFRAWVGEGIAAGELEALEPEALARFLGGTVRAFLLSLLAEETAPDGNLASTTVDLFLHGAARRPSGLTT